MEKHEIARRQAQLDGTNHASKPPIDTSLDILKFALDRHGLKIEVREKSHSTQIVITQLDPAGRGNETEICSGFLRYAPAQGVELRTLIDKETLAKRIYEAGFIGGSVHTRCYRWAYDHVRGIVDYLVDHNLIRSEDDNTPAR